MVSEKFESKEKNPVAKENVRDEKVDANIEKAHEQRLALEKKECEDILNSCDGKAHMDELERDVIVTKLENLVNIKDPLFQTAVKDMIYQIQNERIPLKSLLKKEEQERRKKIIEGSDEEPGIIDDIKERIEKDFSIKMMKDFGMDPKIDAEEFSIMKQKIINMMNDGTISVEYFNVTSFQRVTGFRDHTTGKIQINVGSMNAYQDDFEFESDFKKTLLHEVLHNIQKDGYEKIFNPENGFAKGIFGDNKEADDFLEGMFAEGGSIVLANMVSDIFTFDEYQFHSVVGLNYLFYGRQDKLIPYGRIFSKLRYFGKIEDQEKDLLVDYLKKEFADEPIKGYLDAKKQETKLTLPGYTASNEELIESKKNIFNKLREMIDVSGSTIATKEMKMKLPNNDFLRKVYPGWEGENHVSEFEEMSKQEAIKQNNKGGSGFFDRNAINREVAQK